MPELSVWAPAAHRVRVRITDAEGAGSETELTPDPVGGWWRADCDAAHPGADYGFLLDDSDDLLPDPRSRRQPAGVHGPSRVYADDFAWSDQHWTGRALPGAVIYELHVGTFTEAGNFDAAVDRLDHLVDLGVTHVELLPVNSFNGTHNWGYDGVAWYAVQETYGGPQALKRFVNACHSRRLAVVLDVVYNHLGPSGNYLPRFGPYFTQGRNTWGDLINLDGPGSHEVRRLIIDNALMWLAEFHLDSLRLDAVHALQDSSSPHLLAQLALEVDALQAHVARPLTLIAESDLNDPVMITAREAGGHGLAAQWDDDVHHALHVLLSGERQGYYHDFAGAATVAKVMTRAFYHDGTYSSFRRRTHGKPVDRGVTPGYRFVVCLQNHDQVGNRAAGDRLAETVPAALLTVGAMLLLSSPFTPMLWMGEEWAASTRWTFFTSHPEPELAEATGKGRIEEFGRHGWDVSQMIDPQDPSALRSSILDWAELTESAHASMLAAYRELIGLRRAEPWLSDPRLDLVHVDYDDDEQWFVMHRGPLRVVANLGEQACSFEFDSPELLYRSDPRTAVDGLTVTVAPNSGAIVRTASPAPSSYPVGP